MEGCAARGRADLSRTAGRPPDVLRRTAAPTAAVVDRLTFHAHIIETEGRHPDELIMTAWWGQNSSSRWGQNQLSFPAARADRGVPRRGRRRAGSRRRGGLERRAATPRGRGRRLRRRPARARHGGSRGTLACAAPVRPHARPRGSARPAAARRRRAARAGPPPLAGPLVRTRRLRGVSTLFAGVTSACRRCGDRDHATSAGSLRARLWQRAATPCFRAGSALSTRRSRFCGSAPLESVARGHGPGRSRTCGEAREPGGIMEPGGRAQRSSAAGAVESAREWMVSGGARGLQNRCGAALQSRVGSTPTHSRHRRSPG